MDEKDLAQSFNDYIEPSAIPFQFGAPGWWILLAIILLGIAGPDLPADQAASQESVSKTSAGLARSAAGQRHTRRKEPAACLRYSDPFKNALPWPGMEETRWPDSTVANGFNG